MSNNKPDGLAKNSTNANKSAHTSKAQDIQSGSLMTDDYNTEFEHLRLQELKAKIKEAGVRDADKDGAKPLTPMQQLAATMRGDSELEKVASKLLIKLNQLSDYSPQYAQIMSLTGKTSRTEIARHLSLQYCNNFSTKRVLDSLMGEDVVQSAFASYEKEAEEHANVWVVAE